jgi:hypothetical protein
VKTIETRLPKLIIKKPNISSPLLILAVSNWEDQANLSNQEA